MSFNVRLCNQINDQAADKQNIMDRRFMEIETSNNHLTEELARLTVEFELAKERERTCNEEIERARAKISTVEEENRSLETQIRNLQNANQLTQVSIVASQTNYDGLEMELERVTQELQVTAIPLIKYRTLETGNDLPVASFNDDLSVVKRNVSYLRFCVFTCTQGPLNHSMKIEA